MPESLNNTIPSLHADDTESSYNSIDLINNAVIITKLMIMLLMNNDLNDISK